MSKILSFITLLFCQYLVVAQVPLQENDIVATINGEPISMNEFAFHAQQNKFKVISMFRNEKNHQYREGFWDVKSAGKSPGDVLRTMTLDSLVHIKVQYLLAKQYGIINDISFEAIQQYLQSENKERKDALQKNIVIYGPQQFSMESYFGYLTSNMVIKVKDYMVRNKLIKIDVSKGIPRTDKENISHDDDKTYPPAYISRLQVNEQYNNIVQQLVKKAVVKVNKKQMKELSL